MRHSARGFPILLASCLLLITGCDSDPSTAENPPPVASDGDAERTRPPAELPPGGAVQPPAESAGSNANLFAPADDTFANEDAPDESSTSEHPPAKQPEFEPSVKPKLAAAADKPAPDPPVGFLDQAREALADADVRRAERLLLAQAIYEPDTIDLRQVMQWCPALQKPIINLRFGVAWYYANPPPPVAEAAPPRDDEQAAPGEGGLAKPAVKPEIDDDLGAVPDRPVERDPGDDLPDFDVGGAPEDPAVGLPGNDALINRAEPAPANDLQEAAPPAEEPEPNAFAPILSGVAGLNRASFGTGSRVLALLRVDIDARAMGTMMRRAARVADDVGATIDPAIRLLGDGGLEESLAAARTADCDILLYAVMVRQTLAPRTARGSRTIDDPRDRTLRGPIATTRSYELRSESERRALQWRIFRVDTGREIYRSQRIVSQQSSDEFGGDSAVQAASDSELAAIETYLKQYVALRRLPPFQSASAKARAGALAAPKAADPLRVMSELQLYRRLSLIDEDEFKAYQAQLLGPETAAALASGTDDQRRAIVNGWLSQPHSP